MEDVEAGASASASASEERIGEADTTDNNDIQDNDAADGAGVVVCQAVADEGLHESNPQHRFSEPLEAPRTSNCSGGGSPDDGGGDATLNDNSRDLVYNRADSGAALTTTGHRNSTEGVGDVVSGSGFMEDESEFRTTSFVNGEGRSAVSTSESEAAVREEDGESSDKCLLPRRKRTASQAQVDDDADDAASFRSSSVTCRPSGSQERGRCRSQAESDSITNGKDDMDDEESNS